MEAMRKADKADQTQAEADAAWRGVVERHQEIDKGKENTEAQPVLRTRTKSWIIFAGFCLLFCSPAFSIFDDDLFPSGQVDASNQDPTPSPSSRLRFHNRILPCLPLRQPAPLIEERATVEKDVEQPEAIPMTSSPIPVSPAPGGSRINHEPIEHAPDELQLKVEAVDKSWE